VGGRVGGAEEEAHGEQAADGEAPCRRTAPSLSHGDRLLRCCFFLAPAEACVEAEEGAEKEFSNALSCCGDWRERGLLFIVATKGLTGNLDPIKESNKITPIRLYAYTKNSIVVVPNASMAWNVLSQKLRNELSLASSPQGARHLCSTTTYCNCTYRLVKWGAITFTRQKPALGTGEHVHCIDERCEVAV